MATIIKEPLRALGLEGLFDWAKEVIKKAILDGRLIEDVTISGTSVIDHGLDRVPRGAIVVKSDSGASFQVPYDFTKQSFTITVTSGTPVVSVWVF